MKAVPNPGAPKCVWLWSQCQRPFYFCDRISNMNSLQGSTISRFQEWIPRSVRVIALGPRQRCHGWQYVEDEVARKPRRDQRQALTFKTMPPLTDCFQLGSVSRTFYSFLTVSSSYDSVLGFMHSWRRSSQSSVSSQWLSLPIRKQVFNMWAFVGDTSDKTLAEPLLHQNSSLKFLAWATLGRPSCGDHLLLFIHWHITWTFLCLYRPDPTKTPRKIRGKCQSPGLLVAVQTVATLAYGTGFSDPFIHNLRGLLTIPMPFSHPSPCCSLLRARLVPVLALYSLGFLAWGNYLIGWRMDTC